MKRIRFSEEHIIAILGAGGRAKTVEVCRKHGISDATFGKWKAKSNLILERRGVLKAEEMPVFPSAFARLMSAVVCTGVIRSALSVNQRFHRTMLRIVSANPSQIEQVQFAAVAGRKHSHVLRFFRRVGRFTTPLVLSAVAISRAAQYQWSSCLPSG
jgi:hypothetical protein